MAKLWCRHRHQYRLWPELRYLLLLQFLLGSRLLLWEVAELGAEAGAGVGLRLAVDA